MSSTSQAFGHSELRRPLEDAVGITRLGFTADEHQRPVFRKCSQRVDKQQLTLTRFETAQIAKVFLAGEAIFTRQLRLRVNLGGIDAEINNAACLGAKSLR